MRQTRRIQVTFAAMFGSGTIGQVKCCSTISTNPNCTICDNTNPPSNCQPRTVGKFDPGSVFHPNKGRVLSQNDDSSDSKGIDSSSIQKEDTFNTDNGSNSQSNSENKIDSSKNIEGWSFNQKTYLKNTSPFLL